MLICNGVADKDGATAAADIASECAQHRTHHKNVQCTYAAEKLTLTVENDFDPTGAATMDEFSDCLCAYLMEPFSGLLEIQSVVVL